MASIWKRWTIDADRGKISL